MCLPHVLRNWIRPRKKKQLSSVKPWNYAWGDIVPIDNAHAMKTSSRRGRGQCSTTMDGFATLPGSNAWTHWDTTTAAGRSFKRACWSPVYREITQSFPRVSNKHLSMYGSVARVIICSLNYHLEDLTRLTSQDAFEEEFVFYRHAVGMCVPLMLSSLNPLWKYILCFWFTVFTWYHKTHI